MIRYGKWVQKEEFVNDPIYKMIPAAVIHVRVGGSAEWDARVAVNLQCAAADLPLVLRFSRSLDETSANKVTINNANNASVGQNGSSEVRDLGQLREEFILVCDYPITIFGNVSKNENGDFLISNHSRSSLEPWVATHDTVYNVLQSKQKVANGLFYLSVVSFVLSGGLLAYAGFELLTED